MLDFPDRVGVFGHDQVLRLGHDRLRRAGLATLARERPDVHVVEGVHVLTGSAYTASTSTVTSRTWSTGVRDLPVGQG